MRRRFHTVRQILTVCTLAGLLLTTASCDETTIDPFSNDDRFFTVYGYLDALETEHTVRVIPVTRFPERIESPTEGQASIDATVASTNLNTGETTRWRHSLEQLDDGTYAHIFRASFVLQPRHTYRLEVRRSDGVTTTAETTLPYIGQTTYYAIDPVAFNADSSEVTQDIYIPNVPSLWGIRAAYYMSNLSNDPNNLNGWIFVSHGRTGERTDDGGWNLRVNISEDQVSVRQQIDTFIQEGIYEDFPVGMSAMALEIRLLDANWDPPEGVFDPEVLAQPGTLSNVENGYGFWGSVGFYRQEWQVTSDLSVLLGYDG